ncbi:MAG: protoglobin domain-containing protein [Thermodesulfovibrionales bacterium]
MRSFKEIKAHYDFREEDEKRLLSLKDLMTAKAESAMEALHSWILQTKDAARFFTEETIKNHVFGEQKKWFLDLFSGRYDSRYYERLIGIGHKHVKALVDAHYMNRAVNIVRNFCISAINESIEDTEERTKAIISVEKILDINLDIITSSYIEEELRAYSPAYRVKNALISFSERFSQTMNLILVLALIGLTIGVIGLFVSDVQKLFSGELESGIITALGSLLILWVVIELMDTEIAHLRGGKFQISVFIGVALVTTIRETMIATLKHERPEIIYYLVAAVLVIGLVYWLVKRTEEKK